ncbi:DUF5374 domain-containing protein [Basfia succiniciproducens]|uniref:DUF5374 domain-containing protein n=1 Tax=Basfia succiniciproducens TaxID=653940 RepID=UPI0008C92254|nr:DUF5374 domain-containing protein [Basfia succiniciproducens]SEQ48845.1 prepilin peptidase dependent protein C [Basfia succiniciproducens]
MRKITKGMTSVSLLITMVLFSVIMLSILQWSGYQRKSAVEIYQYFQAVQIAENQKQRLFLGLGCESQVVQNGIQFRLLCAGEKITVSYPMGKLTL